MTRLDPALIEGFRALATPLVSDNLHRLRGAAAGLRPWHGDAVMVGRALTVRTRPGDNLMVHKAIDLAEPGDVVVVDAGGAIDNAIVGDIMMRLAMKRGAAGFVIDGAARDLAAYRETGFPLFARAITHRGPWKDGPGLLNVPVSIGGLVVRSGDLVMGDLDGLLAAPAEEAPRLLEAARTQGEAEARMLAAIEDGSIDRSWVDARLAERGLSA
jgi:regulator of RNase E activity RraA